MTTGPLVSIVVPCFNGDAFVAEAIRSALAQTWDSIEIVVVDDGSTDQSREVIREFGDRVKLIATPNRGGGAARNTGIDAATGEFIQFLDCDDVLLADCVAHKMSAETENGESPVCDWRTVGENGRDVEIQHAVLDGDPVAAQLRNQMPTPSPLHRRRDLLDAGGFDESLPCSQERDLHLRLACRGIVFRRLPEVLHEVRRRVGSVSSDYLRVLVQHEKIFLRCIESLRENGGWTKPRAAAFAQAFARDGQHLMRYPSQSDTAKRYFERADQLSSRGSKTIYCHPLKRTLASLFGCYAVERWFSESITSS